MKRKITIWAACFVALLVWSGSAFAQTAKPSTLKTVKLPTGEEVFDIYGEWDFLIENFGEWEEFGTYTNVAKIAQDGTSFYATILKDNPPPSPLKAGSFVMKGEVDKNGITKILLMPPIWDLSPDKWKITEDGNKILINEGTRVRLTFTRKCKFCSRNCGVLAIR